jgi:hypothetical protein
MARRPRTPGIESSVDLAKKAEILERELEAQRTALERLKQMGPGREPRRPADTTTGDKRRTA